MQFRIGDRDPVTGLYYVIWPDGSQMLNGLKIFNAAHAVGDVVLATQRSDGMMILDSVKAATDASATVTREFGLQKFGEQPVGYLNGQIWNNEDEVILPTVSIEFAPGSLQELAPQVDTLDQIPYSQRVFVVRIKIDRPQPRDLQVKLGLSGTALSSNYTTVTLPSRALFSGSVKILSGALYADVEIFHSQPNRSGINQTIVLTAISQREYRISKQSVTATILYVPILSLLTTVVEANLFKFTVRADRAQTASLRCEILLSGTLTAYTASPDVSDGIIIAAGEQSATFLIQTFPVPPDIGKRLDILLTQSDSYRREFPVSNYLTIVQV